jgi:hypothetical protein
MILSSKHSIIPTKTPLCWKPFSIPALQTLAITISETNLFFDPTKLASHKKTAEMASTADTTSPGESSQKLRSGLKGARLPSNRSKLSQTPLTAADM